MRDEIWPCVGHRVVTSNCLQYVRSHVINFASSFVLPGTSCTGYIILYGRHTTFTLFDWFMDRLHDRTDFNYPGRIQPMRPQTNKANLMYNGHHIQPGIKVWVNEPIRKWPHCHSGTRTCKLLIMRGVQYNHGSITTGPCHRLLLICK